MSEDWIRRLTDLGRAVRDAIRAQRGGEDLAAPVAFEGGDTIYGIDRRVEPLIIAHAERWAEQCGPGVVVAEGLGAGGVRPFGRGEARWRALIDPIDGTRNIMYDKRSAWFLGAVAPDRGEQTRLHDAVASVMVELPTSKAGWADEFGATREGPVSCARVPLEGGVARDLPVRPSAAPDLRHGWGQVTNFFPGTKALAADLMERIARETLGEVRAGEALVFDDQYLTTGGQLVELICGRDRFCCDLRPLMFEIVRARGGAAATGLTCHPYDMAGLLVAQRAGVVVTDGFGSELDAPFAVDHGVHWCGYANGSLREAIEPIIRGWLREHGVGTGDGPA